MHKHLVLTFLLLAALGACTKSHPSGNPDVQVFAGWTDQAFVLVGDQLYANGDNTFGQLGLGNTVNATSFKLTLTDVASVSSCFYYTLVLKKDGTVWAAGLDSAGQFGDGTTDNTASWREIMTDVKAISTGMGESFFIKTDNTLWGGGADLGWAGFTPRKLADGVLSVTAGTGSALFVKTDNTLWGVGQNLDGELGDGTENPQPVPELLMTGVLSASMSDYHSLILKTDHTLWAVGDNGAGQLGTPDKSAPWTPVQVLSDVMSFQAGPTNAAAIKYDSTLWMTGDNFSGELGDGLGGPSGTEQRTYAFKQVLTGTKQVSMRSQAVMVVKGDNTVWVTGDEFRGQFGLPPVVNGDILTFTQMSLDGFTRR